MKMSRTWNICLAVTMIALVGLAAGGVLRLLNVLILKLGGLGVMMAILALVYAVIRKREEL